MRIYKEYWFVVIAGILSGLVVFGGKLLANLGLSLYEVSVIPFAFATIILLVYLIFIKRLQPKKGLLGLLLFYGLISAFLIIAQFGAVIMGVYVAITVLLLYTQPLWTIIISRFWLKEKVSKRDVISSAIVILAVFILVNPFQLGNSNNWVGIIMALIGGISLSGWVVVGSILSKKGNNPLNTLFAGNFLSIIFILLTYPLAAKLIHDDSLVRISLNFSPINWIYILAFGLLVGVASQLFYLNGVKKVPTVSAGIILLLEPISAALLAVFFLKQPLTINIIIAGILILFANYLVLIDGDAKNH